MHNQNKNKTHYDTSIVRPQLLREDFKLRNDAVQLERLKTIKKGLHTLHTLELMAMTIYRFQITKENCELNQQLIAAMCNEMTHYQDFQVKLFEYGFKLSIHRWMYWIVGFVFGSFSRIIGKKAILKTGIWVEMKAVNHYNKLLSTIEWDEDTRTIIEKDKADENSHINNWKKLLESNKNIISG